jgi:hypothetical protein
MGEGGVAFRWLRVRISLPGRLGGASDIKTEQAATELFFEEDAAILHCTALHCRRTREEELQQHQHSELNGGS